MGPGLKQLVDRLPQAFEQTADVLEMLAAKDKIAMEQGRDSKAEAATTAAELRTAAAGSEQMAKDLADPASALFSWAVAEHA